jgi:hypothetical protein
MVKRSRRTVEQMEFNVETTQKHITDGECRLAHRCMEKLAIAEALMKLFPKEASHHVRIDAGHIRFNANGYRWIANTPKIARRALIDFDRKRPVRPHNYRVAAQRTTKIVPNPRKRQDQINKARRERVAAGVRDKTYTAQSLRKRIIGFR